MTTLRSRIHTESTSGFAVSILANLFVYRRHFGISFESFEYFVSPPRITPRAIVRRWRPVLRDLRLSLSGVDSLKEALTDFGREQVLEDFHVREARGRELGCLAEATVSTDCQGSCSGGSVPNGGRHSQPRCNCFETAELGGIPVPLYLRPGRDCRAS